MRKKISVFLALLLLGVSALVVYQAIFNPIIISFAPTSQPGIEILKTSGGSGRLLWSPTENVALGSYTSAGPCPDWGCPQESEIFLIDLDTGQKNTVLELKQYGVYPSGWSLDGKTIMFTVEGDGELEKGRWSLSLADKTPPRGISDQWFATWNYDGSKMAVVDSVEKSSRRYSIINIFDSVSGQEEQVYESEAPETYIRILSWSRDDELLAFSNSNTTAKIGLLELRSGKLTELKSNGFEYRDAVFSPHANFIALEKHDPRFYKYSIVIRDLIHECDFELPVDNVSALGSWSPDGRKFVFSTFDNEIYVIDLQALLGFDFQRANSICP